MEMDRAEAGSYRVSEESVKAMRKPGEVRVLINALRLSMDDLDKNFDILKEQLLPIRSSRPINESDGPQDKRGADTELGQTIGEILDRLQLLNVRMARITDELEI